MITVSDFVHLPYTRDLTEGGIAYAVHSLPYTYNRMGGSPYERLRRIVLEWQWNWPSAATLQKGMYPSM